MSIALLAAQIRDRDEEYRAGMATISDAEFDSLRDELAKLAPDHPVLQVPGGGDKLLSLGNQPFDDWYAGIEDNTTCLIQPKIDGVAIACRYRDGHLVKAWTRKGKDVTFQLRMISNLPQVINSQGVVDVRGELYGFGLERSRSQRLAAGHLRKASPSGKGLRFCAFEILEGTGTEFSNLDQLLSWKFETPGYIRVENNLKEAALIYQKNWVDGTLFTKWPTDGIVIKVADKQYQKKLGASSVCPRWAVALKEVWKESY